jgi:hypothetical protein
MIRHDLIYQMLDALYTARSRGYVILIASRGERCHFVVIGSSVDAVRHAADIATTESALQDLEVSTAPLSLYAHKTYVTLATMLADEPIIADLFEQQVQRNVNGAVIIGARS